MISKEICKGVPKGTPCFNQFLSRAFTFMPDSMPLKLLSHLFLSYLKAYQKTCAASFIHLHPSFKKTHSLY